MATFTHLSSIVDDVNNQTLLRHTQLFIEGTFKVRYNIIANVVDNLESLLIVTFMFFFTSSLEESFGTVPYLGTFLTDITMINTRYQNYIKV